MVGGGLRVVSSASSKTAEFTHLFKICLCGSAESGKTAAMKRYKYNAFEEEYLMTIGVDFAVQVVQSSSSDYIKLQLWDTAGQERFRTITNSYYRGAHGIVIFFDLTSLEAFAQVPNWIDEVKNYSSEDVVIILAGTKTDLVEERVVTPDESAALAANNDLQYIEISSQNGDNVSKLFEMMVEKMIWAKAEYRTTKHSTAMSTMTQALQKSQPTSQNGSSKKSKSCVIL